MASLSFLLTLLQMVDNDHGNIDGSVSFFREKAVIVGNVLLIVLVILPHYASDSVMKYNKKTNLFSLQRMESPPLYLPYRFTELRTKSELLLWH